MRTNQEHMRTYHEHTPLVAENAQSVATCISNNDKTASLGGTNREHARNNVTRLRNKKVIRL
jgi:hypothetical protein